MTSCFVQVRCKCVSFCRNLIINHGRESPFSKEVVSFFKPRRHDTDETVRVEVVLCIRGIVMKDIQLVSDELLDFLKERVLDKKVSQCAPHFNFLINMLKP